MCLTLSKSSVSPFIGTEDIGKLRKLINKSFAHMVIWFVDSIGAVCKTSLSTLKNTSQMLQDNIYSKCGGFVNGS